MKRGKLGEADRVLPSVLPERATENIIEFLENTGTKNNIMLFHVEDDKCLLPFMRSHGLTEEMKMAGWYCLF